MHRNNFVPQKSNTATLIPTTILIPNSTRRGWYWSWSMCYTHLNPCLSYTLIPSPIPVQHSPWRLYGTHLVQYTTFIIIPLQPWTATSSHPDSCSTIQIPVQKSPRSLNLVFPDHTNRNVCIALTLTTPWRHLDDTLTTPWRHLDDKLTTPWRHLDDSTLIQREHSPLFLKISHTHPLKSI